jgi:DNA-binding HxlR family transcriptional regulator
MLPREYKGHEACSVASTLAVIGDRWTMLILREAFMRTRRFEDFQRALGVARNVLSERLGRLTDEGILERRAYQDNPVRYEYRLTDKGLDLWPTLMSLLKWGDRHAVDAPAVLIVHRGCGGEMNERLRCERCGQEMGPRDAEARPGPGAGSPSRFEPGPRSADRAMT